MCAHNSREIFYFSSSYYVCVLSWRWYTPLVYFFMFILVWYQRGVCVFVCARSQAKEAPHIKFYAVHAHMNTYAYAYAYISLLSCFTYSNKHFLSVFFLVKPSVSTIGNIHSYHSLFLVWMIFYFYSYFSFVFFFLLLLGLHKYFT